MILKRESRCCLPDPEVFAQSAGGGGIGEFLFAGDHIGSIEASGRRTLRPIPMAASKAGVNHLTRIMAKFFCAKAHCGQCDRAWLFPRRK